METNAIIAVLGTVIVSLAGVIAWLVKRDKREAKEREDRFLKESAERENKFLEIIQQNNMLLQKTFAIMDKMEKLLTNWRGH